jgi:GT2 family glycosyltransferase
MKREVSEIKISIIIVYYQDLKSLLGLLRSIRENEPQKHYEIILVDNSNEDIIDKIAKSINLRYIKSSGNIGYSRGNNLGASYARGKYLFIINPDTRVKKGTISTLTDFLDQNKNVAIIAPNLVDDKGKLFENQGTITLTPLRAVFSLTILSKIFPGNKIKRDYYLKDVPKEDLREVDVVPGSAFMIRKKIFEDLGGFDKNLFLYFEEFDLCKRVKDAGYKMFMTPKGVVEHDWIPGDGGIELKKYFVESRFYYFKKNYGLFKALVVELFSGITKWHLLIVFTLLMIAFYNKFIN